MTDRRLLVLIFLLCSSFLMATEPTLVYLVRHAEKVDESRDADLSEQGLARAQALAGFFKNISFTAIYATQYQRTKKTVAPTAKAHDMMVDVVPAGKTQAQVEAIHTHKGGVFLISGHSNTIPDLIEALGAEKPVIEHHQYDQIFLVVLHKEAVQLQTFSFRPW